MADLTGIAVKHTELIRKIQQASVFVAPIATAIPAAFTTGATADLTALPAAWKDVGVVTKSDAYTWSRSVNMAETTSHGFVDPTRRDITSNVTSLQFTAQELSKVVLEQYHNVDLSAVTSTVTTNEFTFSDPLAPATRFSRIIAIGQDGAGTNAIFIIRIIPRAIMTAPGDQSWSDDNELTFPMEFSAVPDTVLGYSMRYVFGGPGWKALITNMGIT